MTIQSSSSSQSILLSGAHGLVGSALSNHLSNAGYVVNALSRHGEKQSENTAYWNTATHSISLPAAAQYHAVIHLAGAGIADKRWSESRKQEIRESRVLGTRALVKALEKQSSRPAVLISASACGYYGDRGEETLTEASAMGQGFLPQVAVEWEHEALQAERLGIRVVLLRFGIILSSQGGALKKMLPAFKLGLGGPLGDGTQWMSWIALPDVLKAVLFVMQNQQIHGPVNIVAPQPVTNREFSKTLASVLHRPCVFSVPRFVLQALFGEMADQALLSSTRSIPKKLEDAGFEFDFPEIRAALSLVR